MKISHIFAILYISIMPCFLLAQNDSCEDQIEQMEVIVTIGYFSENQSWGISGLDGNDVITINSEIYAASPPGFQVVHNIELKRCLGYEIYFGKDFMKDSLFNPSWELTNYK